MLKPSNWVWKPRAQHEEQQQGSCTNLPCAEPLADAPKLASALPQPLEQQPTCLRASQAGSLHRFCCAPPVLYGPGAIGVTGGSQGALSSEIRVTFGSAGAPRGNHTSAWPAGVSGQFVAIWGTDAACSSSSSRARPAV